MNLVKCFWCFCSFNGFCFNILLANEVIEWWFLFLVFATATATHKILLETFYWIDQTLFLYSTKKKKRKIWDTQHTLKTFCCFILKLNSLCVFLLLSLIELLILCIANASLICDSFHALSFYVIYRLVFCSFSLSLSSHPS